MTYNGGRHPNLYENMTAEEKDEIRMLDSIIHRRDETTAPGAGPSQVVLQDDTTSDEDDDDENTAMLEDAGLLLKRPVILQGGLRDEFLGRQTVSKFFDLMDENRRIDREAANKPPPTYYWTPGHEDKYEGLSAWGRVKHNLHWVGYKAFWGLAFVGEVRASI